MQAIPCPYPGEINVDLSTRNKIDKVHIAGLNAEFKNSRAQFQPYIFSIVLEPPLPSFSRWWHNSMGLYHKSANVKNFVEDLGIAIEEKSDSISDDGFGESSKEISQGTEHVPRAQSPASIPAALNIKPLRSVPQMVTRSKQQSSPSPSESTPKKKTRKKAEPIQTSAYASSNQSTRRGATKQALSHDATKFDKVYEASKRRRKTLIEEPEEETGNDPISQFVKEKKAQSKHTIASKTPFEQDPLEIQQPIDPPATGATARSLTLDSELIAQDSLNKEPLQKQASSIEKMSEPAHSVLKTAETNLDIGKSKITEANIPVRHVDVSVPKDDRSLFPEIASHTLGIKTFDQLKIVIDETAMGQSSRSGIPEEPILS